MILVPHESVARLNNPSPSTSHTQMNALDEEMGTILQNNSFTHDSEKWKKYNEVLQRYLYFANEARKPISLEIKSVSDHNDPRVTLRQDLVSVIPKSYQEQAVKIHDYLSSDDSPLTWDTAGTVSIQGTPLPKSNIIDLISDLTRFRKHFEPEGVSKFIQTLAKMNIPLDLVGNEKRRTAILRARQSGAGGILELRSRVIPTLPRSRPKKVNTIPKKGNTIHKIVSRNHPVESPRWQPWERKGP